MPKTIKHCDNCGKEFSTYESSAHFCSAQCYNQKREENIKTVECEVCGKSFSIPQSVLLKGKGRFCSKGCSDIARTTKRETQCDNCGKPIVRTENGNRGQHKFCSTECAHQYTVKTRRVTRCCKQCGKEFTVKKKLSEQGAGIYCSAKCQANAIRTSRNATCLYCGKEFFAKGAQLKLGMAKYCCHACYLQGCYRDSGGTTIEQAVSKLLTSMGVDFAPQYRVGRYVCDFFISDSSTRLIVEADGGYWHSSPKAIAKDARKDAYLRALGYTILRLPEERIESDIRWCEEQIRAYI